MRPFSTRRAPSLMGGAKTGKRRLAAKIAGCAADADVAKSNVLHGDAGFQDPVIESGALGRPEAATFNNAPELLLGGAVTGAGLFDDVLFDHDRTHIVAPGVQGYRGGFHRLRDPRGLYVGHVVEDDAAYGRGLQVIQRRSLLEVGVLLEVGGVVRLEGPVDERREAAGFGLKIADLEQVLDPLFVRLVYTEHHRGGGLHPQRVPGLHDLKPRIRRVLGRGDPATRLVREDLRPTSRDAHEAGVFQLLEGLSQRQAALVDEVPDLRRREGMNLY